MKLSITGNQPIIAPRQPILPMEVTTKSYVDASILAHEQNVDLHLVDGERELLAAISVTAEEINRLDGVTSNVQQQIDTKLNRDGGTMTGPLTLSGAPTVALHAASKGYVDNNVSGKLNKAGDTMTGPLTLQGAPLNNLHAATKEYVDTEISGHANDDQLHITATQNLLLDSLTVNAAEINHLSGVTGNVQTQVDAKFDKAGGAVTGDITLAEGKTVFVSKAPAVDSELVNKAYVDAKFRGQEWKNPVSDVNLVSINSNEVPGAPKNGATYIAGATPGPGWEAGYAYTWVAKDGEWRALQERPVAVGDRFGIGFDLSEGDLDGDVFGDAGKLVTITDATAGSIVYQVEELSPGSTTLVFDQDSVKFGMTYTLTDEGDWVVTDTSVNLTAGDAINIAGNTLSVNIGTGLKLDDNNVTLDLKGGDVLDIGDTGLELKRNETNLVNGASGLDLSTGVLNNIADRVSKTEGGTVTGTIVVATNGGLELGFTPSNNTHAVNKQYVDSKVTEVSNTATDLVDRVEELEVDPTTKTYVDNSDALKLNKSGDTMTGLLTLSGAPQTAMHAANKDYVDALLTNHFNDKDLHLTEEQNVFMDALEVSAEEVNYLQNLTSNAQGQLDNKLNLSGGTLSGHLTLHAAPTAGGHAATKSYVDGSDALKLNLTGGTLTGDLTLKGAPTEELHAATKQYVDSYVSSTDGALRTLIDTKLNKTGDTMTGALTLNASPTALLHAVTKGYVDNATEQLGTTVTANYNELTGIIDGISTTVQTLNQDPTTKAYVDSRDELKLNLTGGVLSGNLTLHQDPVEAKHAATKQYVDAIAQGLKVKSAVRLATLTNLVATYNNGTEGVGSTLTGTANAALVVDGMPVAAGDRILVKSQTNKLENGDYIVQQPGTGSTPFILKRTTTVDESREVPGSYFYVFDGNTLKGTGWSFTVDVPSSFTIGTDDIHVNQFSGQGTVIAGNGLALSGNTLSVVSASSDRIVSNAANIDLAQTGVAEGDYTRVTVDVYGRVTAASKPTSYVEMGLTDVQPLNAKLTGLSQAVGAGIPAYAANGSVNFRSITVEGAGLDVQNPDGVAGNFKVILNSTSAATANTVPVRDANGNFAAGTITASLVGNASTATTLANSRNVSADSTDMSAPAVAFNGGANLVLEPVLKPTGVVAGQYSRVTVDAKGRVVEADNPTNVADLGIDNVYTKDEVDAMVEDIERRYQELFTYIITRI